MSLDQIQQIPLAQLYPSEGNRRVGGFDQAKLEQLAESIKAVGVQQPAVVRRRDKGGVRGGLYEIVCGERRWRAAKLAGLKDLPCVVRGLDEVQVLRIQTIENLQREDIHPLDEADGYGRLLERAGYDVEHLAGEVGRSVSYVYQRLKLRDLVAPARKALVDGTITAGHAILIARLPADQQKECLEYLKPRFSGEVASVRELGLRIQQDILMELSKAPFKRADAELVPAAGPCTTCPKRTGAQPELFADVCNGKKVKDYCTDPACYQAKLDALVVRRRAELKGEAHIEALSHAASYEEERDAPKGTLKRYDWEVAKPKEKGAQPVLIVAGPDRGRLTWGTVRKQDTYGRPQKTKKELEAAKAMREAEKASQAARRQAYDAIVASAGELGTPWAREIVRVILNHTLDRMMDDHRKLLAKVEGWEKVAGWEAAQKARHDLIEAMEPDAMELLILKASIVGGLRASTWGFGDELRPLIAVGRALEVDVSALEAELAAKTKEGERNTYPPRFDDDEDLVDDEDAEEADA